MGSEDCLVYCSGNSHTSCGVHGTSIAGTPPYTCIYTSLWVLWLHCHTMPACGGELYSKCWLETTRGRELLTVECSSVVVRLVCVWSGVKWVYTSHFWTNICGWASIWHKEVQSFLKCNLSNSSLSRNTGLHYRPTLPHKARHVLHHICVYRVTVTGAV